MAADIPLVCLLMAKHLSQKLAKVYLLLLKLQGGLYLPQ